MSGKELDNLFRNKLEELETTPSPQAWDKLQSGLAGQQKKIKYPYWRVAAAILLLISFGSIFWWSTQDMSNDKIANVNKEEIKQGNNTIEAKDTQQISTDSNKTEIDIENTLAQNNEEVAKDKNTTVIEESVQPSKTSKERSGNTADATVGTSANQKIADKIENNTTKSASLIETYSDNIATNSGDVVTEIGKELENQSVNSSEITVAQVVTKKNESDATLSADVASSVQESKVEKSKALVFDIEEFDKKTAIAKLDEGAQEEVKQSKFKKVLNFVKSVKEGDGGMAGLREAKDDLFAFDSKKEDNDSE